MSTRAVHLELVSSYSSQDFLAAFRRFTPTRGPCSRLFSDQGTYLCRCRRGSQAIVYEIVNSYAGAYWFTGQ